MALGANSYGSVAGVAALTPDYAVAGGTYDTTTRPTLAQVEKFIDRVSAILNIVLAQVGFAIPVTQADCKLALAQFVTSHCADLCHGANGAGPYAPGSEEKRAALPEERLLTAAAEFVEKRARGFEALGATRSRSATYGLACRVTDEAGDDLVPPFQRKQMGNTILDWGS